MIDKIIKELEKHKESFLSDKNEREYYIMQGVSDAIEIVKKYNDAWTLCSEELPENDGNYLISVSRVNPMVFVSYFDAGHREFDCYADVVAWKPLPQPYNKEV